MPTYVRAARSFPSGRITGTVLHLTTYAPDAPGHGLFPGGRQVPVCGGYRHVERWQITGPWARGWARHARWPLCAACQRMLELLLDDARGQIERAAESDD